MEWLSRPNNASRQDFLITRLLLPLKNTRRLHTHRNAWLVKTGSEVQAQNTEDTAVGKPEFVVEALRYTRHRAERKTRMLIDPGASVPAENDEVVVLLKEIGYDRVDVLGYSMGGGVALRLAVQHPDQSLSVPTNKKQIISRPRSMNAIDILPTLLLPVALFL